MAIGVETRDRRWDRERERERLQTTRSCEALSALPRVERDGTRTNGLQIQPPQYTTARTDSAGVQKLRLHTGHVRHSNLLTRYRQYIQNLKARAQYSMLLSDWISKWTYWLRSHANNAFTNEPSHSHYSIHTLSLLSFSLASVLLLALALYCFTSSFALSIFNTLY